MKSKIKKYKKEFTSFSKTSTVDGYRYLLCRINVLERTDTGQYKKLRSLPKSITSTKARRIATDQSWKNWFIKLEDR